jgi:nicotinamidase-related amidase
MAIWDDVIPESDLKNFRRAHSGEVREWGQQPAIVVVDMSWGFVDSRYGRGNSEMGWPTVRAIQRLLEAGREAGVPIFFTTGYDDNSDASHGRWKSRGSDDPVENQIVPELAPRPDEVVLRKRRASAFFGTDLVEFLVYHRVDTLIVTGMTTSGCVRATVVDAFSYNFLVVIPEECVGDRGVVSHKVSLFDMHHKYADVVPLEQVTGWLRARATSGQLSAVGR